MRTEPAAVAGPYAAVVRPRLINQARRPGMQHVTPAIGLGWAVTEPASSAVSLFDHDLRSVAHVAVPLDDPQINVGATGRLVAVGDKHQVAVLDHSGAVRWRSSWDRIAGGPTAGADFELDGDDTLWIHLARRADDEELIAVRAATGNEIHRMRLPGWEGAWFIPRPADTWTGLALLDPGSSAAALISLVAGRIVLRPLAGNNLAGFSPGGGRYLTTSVLGDLSVRDLDTDAVITERHLDDLPDKPTTLATWPYLDRAVLVTEDLVLIAITAADAQEHLLLAAPSLRCRSQLQYMHPHPAGSIHPAQKPGRWLTHHREEDVLRLWQLDDRLDDEPLLGQIALL